MKLTEAKMRAAVLARDPAMDGRFLFGVVTTGVCCRPICRSRAPRPENLRFFPSLSAAQSAGYRPCKRCRPDRTGSAIDARILDTARHLLAHPDEDTDLARLARRVHWSPFHLQRRFRAALGASPREFQEAVRVGRLRALLRGRGSIARALLDAGFGSQSEAYRSARRALGMTPAAYRRGAERESIAYLLACAPLGWVSMAATDRGVCSVQFGDSPAALRAQLADEFPQASLAEDAPAAIARQLQRWMPLLLRALRDGSAADSVPLDLRGTVFQVRVWRELQRIRAGETRSYAQLARAVGRPNAVRAVAAACAGNRIAVLVPCHRVIRGDGSLAGYRWGLARKRRLLSTERSLTKADAASW